MVLAIEQTHPEIDHWISGEITATPGILNAFFHRWTVVVRNRAAEDLVDEVELGAALHRLDLDPAVRELAASAGLLLVAAVTLGGLEDGFPVGNLRLVQDHIDVVAVLELGDGDLDVLLAGSRDEVFVGLGVTAGSQGEIFLHQPVQRLTDLLLVTLRLRLDRE